MTTTTTEATDSLGNAQELRSWGDITVSLDGQIAQLGAHSRGDLADLRRMNPDSPDAAAFWRLMARYDLLGNEELEKKWALILHGIALMTPTAGGNTNAGFPRHSAHDPTVPVGLALFQGGEPNRGRAFYSETRLNRLLTARGPMLRTLLARLFRMLASADQPFNWRQMSELILNDGFDEDRAETVRRRIARSYYQATFQAERRSAQQSSE